jgi:hypothetical protein
MKRKIALLLCLLSISLATIALVTAVDAQPSTHFAWIEPSYSGYDQYYGDTIIGYLTGVTWNFTLSWTNYYSDPINVSAIRIYFDWGKNYTRTFSSPIQMMPDTVHVFNIGEITPSVAEAPELWTHDYWVYVHHVNSTTGPTSEPWIIPSVASGDNFAVLSQDHFECLNLFTKYNMMFGGLTAMQGSSFFLTNITAAQINFTMAMMEFEVGSQVFSAGMFGAAKTHLQRGDTYFNAAMNSWATKGTAIEDAALAHTKAETNYNNALANSTMVNAYGWLLFGLGWTFIGLGIIIYGLRKPKAATS